MNKLLISLLSLTGVAGLSTGGYFLLRNSEQKESEPSNKGQLNEKQGADQDTKGKGSQDTEDQTTGGKDQPQSPSASQES